MKKRLRGRYYRRRNGFSLIVFLLSFIVAFIFFSLIFIGIFSLFPDRPRVQGLFQSIGILDIPFLKAFVITGQQVAQPVPNIILDDFEAQTLCGTSFCTLCENGGICVVQPSSTDSWTRLFWNQYPFVTFQGATTYGTTSIVSSQAKSGSKSLLNNLTSGSEVTNDLEIHPNNGQWQRMRTYIQPGQTWQLNTYNRMRFWMKVPWQVIYTPNDPNSPTLAGNMNIGTYVANSSDIPGYSAESGGYHFYHFYNIPYTGEWHQIIFDTHPTHRRGDSGGTEQGNQEYPTCVTTPVDCNVFNYFDALTRFYVQITPLVQVFPAEFYFDGFELYEANPNDNIDQIYSLNGVYIPSTNRIYVGWSTPKTEPQQNYFVRYAFQSIYTLPGGWNDAIPAPSGTVLSPASPYNIAQYDETNQIDVAGQSSIFIAIKPQNSALFREIEIPVAAAGPPDTTPPTMPTGLTATPVSMTQINLAWTASSDAESGIARYNVYRDNVLVGQPTGTSFSDTGLMSGTTYTYEVSATNGAGLESGRSIAVSATTMADTTPPTITSVNAISNISVRIIFNEPLNRTVAQTMSNYQINDSIIISSASLGADNVTVTLTTSAMVNGTTYLLTVQNVRDVAGNIIPLTIRQYQFIETLQAPLPSNILAWWKFDEGSGTIASDSSGNNTGGTLTNGPVWTTGRINGALEFDRIDDYVSLANNLMPANINFTWTAWIRPKQLEIAGGVFGYEAVGGRAELIRMQPTNRFLFRLTNSTGSFADVVTSVSISQDTWTHIAAVRQGTAMRIYINGNKNSASNENAIQGVIPGSNALVAIGKDPFNNRFNGTIDEVMIFNKALTDQEVLDIYNGNFGAPSCIDVDGDGYGTNCALGNDCNDSNPTVNPSATEICNDGIDNNCNLLIDGNDPVCTLPSSPPTIAINLPLNGSTLSGGTFVVSYTKAGNLTNVSHTHLILDGTEYMDLDNDGAYQFSGVADGIHTLRAFLVRSDHTQIGNDYNITFAISTSTTPPPVGGNTGGGGGGGGTPTITAKNFTLTWQQISSGISVELGGGDGLILVYQDGKNYFMKMKQVSSTGLDLEYLGGSLSLLKGEVGQFNLDRDNVQELSVGYDSFVNGKVKITVSAVKQHVEPGLQEAFEEAEEVTSEKAEEQPQEVLENVQRNAGVITASIIVLLILAGIVAWLVWRHQRREVQKIAEEFREQFEG